MSLNQEQRLQIDSPATATSDRQVLLRVLNTLIKRPAAGLTGDERLSDLEEWDSLAALDVVLQVEKQYGVTLEMEGVVNCTLVSDLVSLILNAQRQAHAQGGKPTLGQE